MRFGFFILLILGGFNRLGYAEANLVDLSNGVVFPSNNSALFENPAALAKYKKRAVDLAAFFDSGGPSTGTASAVGKISFLGFGIGTWKTDPGRDSATLGLATDLGDFGQVGFNTTYDFSNKNMNWDLGYRGEISKEITLGVVFYQIRDFWPSSWAVGFSGAASSRLIPEFDLLGVTQGPGQFEPAQMNALVGFSLRMFEGVTARFGMPFAIYPEVQLRTSAVEVGVAWWFAKSAAIYGLLNDHRGPKYVVGMKFQ